MVGNIAGKLSIAAARPETRAETKHDCRRDEPLTIIPAAGPLNPLGNYIERR
jgi:hypothetical protein